MAGKGFERGEVASELGCAIPLFGEQEGGWAAPSLGIASECASEGPLGMLAEGS